jgi:hypothetical protein
MWVVGKSLVKNAVISSSENCDNVHTSIMGV